MRFHKYALVNLQNSIPLKYNILLYLRMVIFFLFQWGQKLIIFGISPGDIVGLLGKYRGPLTFWTIVIVHLYANPHAVLIKVVKNCPNRVFPSFLFQWHLTQINKNSVAGCHWYICLTKFYHGSLSCIFVNLMNIR